MSAYSSVSWREFSREQAAVRLHQPDQVTILCPEAVENPVRVHLKAFRQSSPWMAPVRPASPIAGTWSAAPEAPQPVAIHHKPPEVLAICRNLLQFFDACAKNLIFTKPTVADSATRRGLSKTTRLRRSALAHF